MISIGIPDFKSYFSRDFTFSPNLPDISDTDIQKAINEASVSFNYNLFPSSTNEGLTALYYFTAHILLLNTYSADTGGQTNLLQSSRSVGGISESVDIPDWMKQGEAAYYSTTYYGQRYLMLTKPYLDGVVSILYGGTLP